MNELWDRLAISFREFFPRDEEKIPESTIFAQLDHLILGIFILLAFLMTFSLVSSVVGEYSQAPESNNGVNDQTTMPFPIPQGIWKPPALKPPSGPISVSLRQKQIAESFFIQGERELGRQNYAKAREFFLRARNSVPNDGRYYYSLSKVEHVLEMQNRMAVIRAKIQDAQAGDAVELFRLSTIHDLEFFLANAVEVAQRLEKSGKPELAKPIQWTFDQLKDPKGAH